MANDKLYRTSDIYFSAFLMALGVSLKAAEKKPGNNGGQRVIFVLELNEESDLKRFKSAYFGNTGTVKARRFVDEIRALKQMCNT